MTTPRDDIGLSERLKKFGIKGELAADIIELVAAASIGMGRAEAAAQLDALSARVKELEATDCYANLISIIADIREKSGVGGKPMLSELADAIGSKLDAESRATRLQQERDKAVELLKPFAAMAPWIGAAVPDSEVVYRGPQTAITAGDIRAASRLVARTRRYF